MYKLITKQETPQGVLIAEGTKTFSDYVEAMFAKKNAKRYLKKLGLAAKVEVREV